MRGGRIEQVRSRFGLGIKRENTPKDGEKEKEKERIIEALDSDRVAMLNQQSEIKGVLECLSASPEKRNEGLITDCRKKLQLLQEGIEHLEIRLRRLGAKWV